MGEREERLAALGYPLSEGAQALGLYSPALRTANLVFTSGAVPVRDGRVLVGGKVDAEVSLEDAQHAARLSLANALTALRDEVGDLARVRRILRVTGYVASSPGFGGQPAVLNAASQLLMDVFGEAGRATRAAVGVAELPLGCAVELDLIAEVE
jgi:enamine deaminase RidA (YjgF/YER057c/UK114 family)